MIKILLIFLLLNSCQFAPKMELPEINHSDDWVAKNVYVSEELLIEKWWEVFNDPVLNDLIMQASVNNLDNKIAILNLEKSRIEKNIKTSDLLPDIDGTASAVRRKSASTSAFSSNIRKEYQAGFDASWELDLWGKIRNDRRSAKMLYLAEIEEKRAMNLSVTSEVAKNYILLRGYQKQREILKRNIELLDKTYKLTRAQRRAGAATKFDEARAKSQKEIIQAKLPNIKSNIFETIYKISVLVGKEPNYLIEMFREDTEVNQVQDIVPVGLPSTILRRRFDVKIAEYQLAANLAEQGSAVADFFPSFSLTGFAGNAALKFTDIFHSSNSTWNFGGSINLPFFRAGELVGEYKKAKADSKIAMLNYEKTVITALQEVETNLVKYAQEIETRKKLRAALKNNQKIVSLARARYKAGFDDLLAVIDAERSLIEVQDSLVQSEINVQTNLVALFKSLGGGIVQE